MFNLTRGYINKKALFTLLLLPFLALAKPNLIYNIQGISVDQNGVTQFNAISFDQKVIKIFRQNEPLPNLAHFNAIDGKQAVVMPGLIDAHGHVLNYGLSLLRAELYSAKSEQDAVQQVAQYAKQNKTLTWLQGRGWNQELWQNKQFPTAKSLDKVFPDRAVWLRRVDGHAGWANSKAMQLAGITNQTKAPAGGEIVKDQQGQPTGVFIDNAMSLIDNAIPALTVNEQKTVLIKALKSLASLGLTSVHDAGISATTIQAYKQLAQQQQLPIRVYAMLDVTDPDFLSILKQGAFETDDGMFSLKSVKISADGALGSRGAALLADYSDKPHHQGLLLHNPEQLSYYIKTAMQYGFQVNTHAIGDKANQLVLNNYQTLIKQTHTKALRHRVEHAQVLALTDLPRFAKLGVIASMQATHATSDKNMALDRLGKQRLKGAYAWHSLISSGAIIANGSDFPVEPPNPFYGLHAAITRQDRENQPLNGWIPEQKMTPEQALRSFTYHAAYAAHQEHSIGSLAQGKQADFILVDHNLFSQKPNTIWQNKVLATYLSGQQIYSNNQQ